MSENIQSIANGSFVLGNTSATTYQAGPGISITQPSEGTVRISNDETVLWNGASTEFITPSITGKTLSEAPSNFEKLEIWAVWNPWEGNTPVATYYPGNVTAGSYMVFDQAQFMRAGYGKWTISNNVIKMISAAQTTNWPSFQSGSTYGGIVKVIGINRISGGNA